MAHSPRFFIQVRPLDIENYGLHTALILGYLESTSGVYNNGQRGKFYRTLKDVAETLGIGLTTLKKYLPTEEMGWKHYSGYKPGTMEKTTWWEPCDRSEPTRGDRSIEQSRGDRSYIKEEYKEEESGRTVASLPSRAPTPSNFPCDGENGEAAVNDGGVVKITTPPKIQSVKDKTKTVDRRKHMQFCQELLDRMGAGGVKAGGIFAKRITQLKAQGYDDETLRQVASEARLAKVKDEFYAEPMKAFSESGVSGLVAKMENKKTKSKADEIEERMFKSGLYY